MQGSTKSNPASDASNPAADASNPAADAPEPGITRKNQKHKGDKPPPCPHDEIIKIYHETLPTLRRVREWNTQRKKLLKQRWAEKPERQNLDYWRRYFEYVNKSDFLTGRVNGTGDRKSFTADLEWLIRPQNFVKVVEGKYN